VARELFDGFSDEEVANLTSYLRRMGENLTS
jgi:cytochrome c1